MTCSGRVMVQHQHHNTWRIGWEGLCLELTEDGFVSRSTWTSEGGERVACKAEKENWWIEEETERGTKEVDAREDQGEEMENIKEQIFLFVVLEQLLFIAIAENETIWLFCGCVVVWDERFGFYTTIAGNDEQYSYWYIA